MNYGLPYKGSKSRVMKWLLPLLPDGEIFVDLMCGGCSVTHAALLSHKYKRYIINDINPLLPTAFVGALDGSFRNENRWISREKFERIKETDAYASICFSFGNNCRDYLYSRKLEPYKKACHYAVVFDDWKLMEEMCPEVVDAAQTALGGVKDRKQRRLLFVPSIVRRLKEIGNIGLVESNPLYSSCHVKRDSMTRRKGTPSRLYVPTWRRRKARGGNKL